MESLNKATSKYICNGKFEIVKISEENQEEAVMLFMENFPKNENLSISTNLPANPEAVKEIEKLFREVLKDGISFAAKHIESGSLAGLCGNKILAPSLNLSLDEIFYTFKSPEMIFIGNLLDQLENSYNIYKEFNIDCCVEVVFLSTKTGFERLGIARLLCDHTIDFLRAFGNAPLLGDDFPRHVRGKWPKAVCSVFSSKFTQIVGQKLGFDTVGQIKFVDLKYNGYVLSEKLDPIHDSATFAVKKL